VPGTQPFEAESPGNVSPCLIPRFLCASVAHPILTEPVLDRIACA
jgi:hypothetical protein